MTSGDLTFDLTKKLTGLSVIIFDAVSIVVYRVLRGPGAELGGTSPPARHGKHRPPAWRGLNNSSISGSQLKISYMIIIYNGSGRRLM